MACLHRHVAEPLAKVLVAAEEPDLRGNRDYKTAMAGQIAAQYLPMA